MKTYSMSDLQRAQGDVVDTAAREPVALTRRGKTRLVLMSSEHYERLTRSVEDPRRAFHWSELPDDLTSSLTDAVEGWLEHNDATHEG